jgi:hypothetical protein
MRKIILSLTAIAASMLYLFMQSTFAETTFFGPESANNKPEPVSKAPISPDEFKSRVQQQNQQTETNLSQQIKNVTPVKSTPGENAPPFPTPTSAPPQENPAANAIVNPSQPQPTPGYGPPPSQAIGPPTGPANQPPAVRAPASNQPYTGFGPSNSSGSKSSGTSSGKSSGWGVKY